MRKRRFISLSAIGLAAAYLGVVIVVNQNLSPDPFDRPFVATNEGSAWREVGDRLSILTWNIGYAGLGETSEFVEDGGEKFLPPSRQVVVDNLAGVVAEAVRLPADIKLFQEVSDNSPMSYWVPVRKNLTKALGANYASFRKDVATELLPFPLALVHGTLFTTNLKPKSEAVVPLPPEPKPMASFLKRRYALQVARFDIPGRDGDWVVCNLHLSAFDDGGRTRKEQIAAVLSFARDAYMAGNYIVLAGDWNMVLADPGWPSTTDKRFLFWLHDFPRDFLPEGFRIAADLAMPTVRTLYKPYVKGENYVTGIDGFVVSPNVAVESVMVTDTGFVNTDHMPVIGVFRID